MSGPSSQSRSAPLPERESANAVRVLQVLLREKVGILRDACGLEQTVRELEALLADWEPPLGNIGEVQVVNMATLGLLIARAALERTESRGAHFRTDVPSPDPGWQKHIVQRRTQEERFITWNGWPT